MGPNQLTRLTLASSSALKFNQFSPFLPPQANHTMCSWLLIVFMRRTESMRVMSKALKITDLTFILV